VNTGEFITAIQLIEGAIKAGETYPDFFTRWDSYLTKNGRPNPEGISYKRQSEDKAFGKILGAYQDIYRDTQHHKLMPISNARKQYLEEKSYKPEMISIIGTRKATKKVERYVPDLRSIRKMVESDPRHTEGQIILIDKLIAYGVEMEDKATIEITKYKSLK
jgi:hypothetical protein